MRNRRRLLGMVFVIIGIVWIVLSYSRAANRNTYLILGIAFVFIGLVVRVRSGKSAD